ERSGRQPNAVEGPPLSSVHKLAQKGVFTHRSRLRGCTSAPKSRGFQNQEFLNQRVMALGGTSRITTLRVQSRGAPRFCGLRYLGSPLDTAARQANFIWIHPTPYRKRLLRRPEIRSAAQIT